MVWLIISHVFSTILELIHIGRLSDKDKDLEIMILRHQLDVMARLQTKPVKPNRTEKMTLAASTRRPRQAILEQRILSYFEAGNVPLITKTDMQQAGPTSTSARRKV